MGGNAYVLMTASPWRRIALVVALLAVTATLLTPPGLRMWPTSPAVAAPGDSTDDEGGSAALSRC